MVRVFNPLKYLYHKRPFVYNIRKGWSINHIYIIIPILIRLTKHGYHSTEINITDILSGKVFNPQDIYIVKDILCRTLEKLIKLYIITTVIKDCEFYHALLMCNIRWKLHQRVLKTMLKTRWNSGLGSSDIYPTVH